ncbi:uncharacterized protein L201_001059 [Kwoniella dendrophila CBS 6074]|uniref:Las1-domain-containing protein n=1 Tax=Kwoniella dendrophila CBS 6074 TaxID=1295534 RepID=A0AAX4JLA9_9TREE
MKAPKRTPWSSRSELEELYEMLFSPNADTSSRRRGLSRMSIYISSPSCPTFIHLLHSLVSVELLPYPDKRSSIEEIQRSRMMIGMAIVRFINGLVDPLQNGPYAKPISHLAASLSIPPSLISLRHRATHEDLPPLKLLHQSLLSCISYLHYYSFLPLLANTSSSSSEYFNNDQQGMIYDQQQNHQMKLKILNEKKIEGLIKKWKKVIKLRLREKEVREEDESAIEIRKIKKDLLTSFLLQPSSNNLDLIVNVLCQKGILVPIALQKRTILSSDSPTKPSLKIWLPLLEYLQENSNGELIDQLTNKILDILLNPNSLQQQQNTYPINDNHGSINGVIIDEEKKKEDEISYRWNLAVWLIWFWNNNNNSSHQKQGESSSSSLLSSSSLKISEQDKNELMKRILAAMLELHDDFVIRRLFNSLQKNYLPDLKGLDNLLPEIQQEEEKYQDGLKGLEIEMDIEIPIINHNDNLDKMQSRLQEFELILQNHKSTILSKSQKAVLEPPNSDLVNDDSVSVPIQGWRKLTCQEWTPCPIGRIGTI